MLLLPAAAAAQVTVTIDPMADVHPISPRIYGVNFAATDQVKAGGITLTRWGGNTTSRYNYQIDVANSGNDYFFENIAGCWNTAANYCNPAPADPKGQSGANAFLTSAAGLNLDTLFTIPTLGWVAKGPPAYAHPFLCGFPKSAIAAQDQFDPYDANCGNGLLGGKNLTPPAATTTSMAVDTTWTSGWVTYLTGKFGPAKGHRIYALDNEPNLWSSTHRDVRTTRLGYDELWQRMRDHAEAILQADPTAEIAGPAEWGWPNYLCSDADDISKGCSASSPDRAKHGGQELTAWLLDQARAYEQQKGKRILHYLDLHYYPQGGNPPEVTRSLWDPSYTDPSFINAAIRLIPRMRDWVNQHYPGTKTLVSEYDFYHHNEAVGAITYAEVLGIFGREGLDAATAWSPPAANEAAFGAFKLYRNYDGQGGAFESVSVRATVNSAGRNVQAYAAVGATRATIVLVNEDANPVDVTVSLGSFSATGAAAWFTGNGNAITRQADAPVQSNQATVRLPGTSFGLVAVGGTAPALPDFAVPTSADGGTTTGGGSTATGCSCHLTAAAAPNRAADAGGAAALLLVLWRLQRRRSREATS